VKNHIQNAILTVKKQFCGQFLLLKEFCFLTKILLATDPKIFYYFYSKNGKGRLLKFF
jgi:hypothetical protein